MIETYKMHIFIKLTVNGPPGMHGQAVGIPVALAMVQEIKPEQGPVQKQLIAGLHVFQLMEMMINLAVLSVQVRK